MEINRAIILGRLGQDPKTHVTENGHSICNFSLATSENWTSKDGEKQEKTEWHRVVVFGKLAEICQKYLEKGRLALIEGKIQTRKWEDKDGAERFTTEINASNVQFVGGKSEGSQKQGDYASDDVPF